MKANHSESILLSGTAQVVAEEMTDEPVSKPVTPTFLDALNGLVDVKVSALTDATGTIKAKVQDSSDGGTTWNTVKESAAITATGTHTIRWNAQNTTDQAYVPLRPLIRVVMTTGTGDTLTVSDVRLCSRG